MNKLTKLFIMLVCCTAATTLTSCLNSDDDNGGLNPETEKVVRSNMAGTYGGTKIFFYNDTITDKKNTNKIDSICSSLNTFRVNATDSTIVLSEVPGRLISKAFNALQYPTETSKELAAALEKAPAQPLTCKFAIYGVNDAGYAGAYVAPYAIKYPNITFGDKTHTVYVTFFNPSTLGYLNKKMAITVCVQSIYLDDEQSAAYTFYGGNASTSDKAANLASFQIYGERIY